MVTSILGKIPAQFFGRKLGLIEKLFNLGENSYIFYANFLNIILKMAIYDKQQHT